MRTRIVYEFDKINMQSEAVVAGLTVSFRKLCAELDFAVVAKCVAIDSCGVANAIVNVAGVAQQELVASPKTELCIYLSPRLLVLNRQVVPTTICIIRDRKQLRGLRIQTLLADDLQIILQRDLGPEVDAAKKELFGARIPSVADERLAETVSTAVAQGYYHAHSLLYAPKGRA